MHVYQLTPIDFGWENLKTVAETVAYLGAKSADRAARGIRNDGAFLDVQDFLSSWESAKHDASAS